MLTFSNNVEPANGFLVRYLRRKLVESDSDVNANKEELLRVLDWVPKLWYHLHTFLEKHSTSDFLIGTGSSFPGDGGGDRRRGLEAVSLLVSYPLEGGILCLLESTHLSI